MPNRIRSLRLIYIKYTNSHTHKRFQISPLLRILSDNQRVRYLSHSWSNLEGKIMKPFLFQKKFFFSCNKAFARKPATASRGAFRWSESTASPMGEFRPSLCCSRWLSPWLMALAKIQQVRYFCTMCIVAFGDCSELGD